MSGAWGEQQAHYDAHASEVVDTRQALQQRQVGPAAPLKEFHNHIKNLLLKCFAYRAEKLLDLCCGRGGDLHKWKGAQVKYVKGLDISNNEIMEARRRYAELQEKRRGPLPRVEFLHEEQLGVRLYTDANSGGYDVVTCMFAIHYFFINRDSLNMFLANVAHNLRTGGVFIATMPDGRRVLERLNGEDEYKSLMLHLVKHWEGDLPRPFGSTYTCSIADTVTDATEVTLGSVEYMSFFRYLAREAAQHGLEPVLNYFDRELCACFDEADVGQPFKHFRPFFKYSDPSLEEASALFGAFVLKKIDAVGGPAPPLPEPAGPPSGVQRPLDGEDAEAHVPKRAKAAAAGAGPGGPGAGAGGGAGSARRTPQQPSGNAKMRVKKGAGDVGPGSGHSDPNE